MFDLIVRNGLIADGSGAPLFRADVAVQDGTIVKVAPAIQEPTREEFDASGLIVAPGFIDSHSHSDMNILCKFDGKSILEQGITTEITGNCGDSTAPYTPMKTAELDSLSDGAATARYMEKGGTFAAFMDEMREMEHPTNVAFYVGHSTLRSKAMNYDNRVPTPEEMECMRANLREAMDAGALGFTTGLVYPPGSYAQPPELLELAKVVAEYPGGKYASHMRSESFDVLKSIQETIAIGKEAGIPVNISHHKIMGRQFAGRSRETLKLINDARSAGQNVTLDAYPYDGGSTLLVCGMPPWHADEGMEVLINNLKRPSFRALVRAELTDPNPKFDNFIQLSGMDHILVLSEDRPDISGKTIAELAQADGKDPYDEIFDLIIESHASLWAIYRFSSEVDIENILRYPATMLGVDALPEERIKAYSHPRGQATFPFFIATFCREKALLTLEECIRKFTGQAADAALFGRKGYVRAGKDADLVIFDYNTINGRAAYGHADIPNDGIRRVYVNGVLAVDNGVITGKKAGKVILRGGVEL